jgi:hypothetical protein
VTHAPMHGLVNNKLISLLSSPKVLVQSLDSSMYYNLHIIASLNGRAIGNCINSASCICLLHFWIFARRFEMFKVGNLSLCIKVMHTIFFINLFRIRVHSYCIHGSHNIGTCISPPNRRNEWLRQYIKRWFYYATVTRTGWINLERLTPNSCTYNPSTHVAPLVEDGTI